MGENPLVIPSLSDITEEIRGQCSTVRGSVDSLDAFLTLPSKFLKG